MYFDNSWTDKNDLLRRGLGVGEADLDDYADFIAVRVHDLIGPKHEAQTSGAQFAAGSGYLYVSSVVARPRGGRKPRLQGEKLSGDFRELTDPDKELRLHASYEAIRAAPVSTGWVADLAGGRDGSQDREMRNWSAYGAAAFHNKYRAAKGGEVPVDADNWEWLHIRGAQIGGETAAANLLAGTFSANSQMIPYESQLQKWHEGNHGKIWARFSAVARDLVLAEQIVIEVASHRHPELGTIPLAEPLRVEFSPLTGRVVDKLLGHLRGLDWRREAGLRGRHPGMNQLIALGPSRLLPPHGEQIQWTTLIPLSQFVRVVPADVRGIGQFLDTLHRARGAVTLRHNGRAVLRTASLPALPAGKRRAAEIAEDAPVAKRGHIEPESVVESLATLPTDQMDEFQVEVTIPAMALNAEPDFLKLPWHNPSGGDGPPPSGGGLTG